MRNGIASLGEMASVFLYTTKANSYLLIPTYDAKSENIAGVETPPPGAIEIAQFHKNDYLIIDFEKQRFEGYFVMYESDGRVTLRRHDAPQPDKKFFRRSIAAARLVELRHVDILGNRYAPKHGKLGDLA